MTTITVSKKRDVDSSIIKDIHYDEHSEVMTVTFKSGGDRYRYRNINESLFERICSAKSLGQFLIQNVFTNPKIHYEIVK